VTLLKFIRAYPYHEKRQFEEDITRLLKEGDPDQEGVARLQRLSSCLLLRRPKRTIQLPRRYDKECLIEFTSLEREKYNELKNRAIVSINAALQQGTDVNRSGMYVNMLQQIESLRLFCDLGLHYHTRHEAMPPTTGLSSEVVEWTSIAQQTFNSHLEMGPVSCSICQSIQSLEDMENLFDDGVQLKKPLFSRCLRYVCAECASNLSRNGRTFQCQHSSACPAVPVSTSIYSLEDVHKEISEPQKLSDGFPSKVIALVADIEAQPADIKW
jgi:SNF2 family DNA or RNA helicase